ncbi:unnamed protein product [Amaranthus hypochondriacus]
MALLRKLFYRKPPDGLLEISERIYVFECCFTMDCWNERNYRSYFAGIVSQLHEQFLEAALLVFNFQKSEVENPVSKIMSECGMTIMDYPRHYEGCPILPVELIHHFLRSTESWLALGPQNILLLHCERGGWPVLAFMLAALLVYRKQYTGEQRTLDLVYKQAPRELLPTLSPLNPIPSQIRYLQYVSRRNVASQWPPLDRALTLDCIMFRHIPDINGEGGFRPSFRIYGQDPLSGEDRTPKLLFSTQKKNKDIHLYKQAEAELVKIDINCNIKGDIVLECTSLHKDLEHEDMMFRIVFNLAFIRSNIIMLNREEIDTQWDTKYHFPKDFRIEVLFSDMEAVTSTVTSKSLCFEEKEGLPVEAFAKIQEFFSRVDWLESKTDASQSMIKEVSVSHNSPKHFEFAALEVLPHDECIGPVRRSTLQELNEDLKSTIFCNPNEPENEGSLFKIMLKDCKLSAQMDKPQNYNVCMDQYKPEETTHKDSGSSITSCVSQKQYIESCGDVNGGKTTSGLLESTPFLAPLPPSQQLRLQTQPGGLQEDLAYKRTHFGLEDYSPSVISRSSQTAAAKDISILSGGLLSPATVKTAYVDPIHKDSKVISSYQLVNSTYSVKTPSRKDHRFETLPSAFPSPPRPSSIPVTQESTLGSLARAECSLPSVQLPSLANEKPANSSRFCSSSFSNVSTQTLENKVEETEAVPSQPHFEPPCKNSAVMSEPCPPALSPLSPLNNYKKGETPTPLRPQKLGSSRSFPTPPPPPPYGPRPESCQPQNSSSVPCAPPLPVNFGKGPPKMDSSKTPAPPRSSLYAKGKYSYCAGSKNSQTRKLKPLHWLKLSRAVQGSLWADTQNSEENAIAPDFDMSELENLFSTSAPNSDLGGIHDKAGRSLGAPKSDKVQLFDHRRAYNCEIMLSKVKIPLQELMCSVLSLEDSSLDTDQVENLIKFCPTKEEMEVLKGYNGAIDKLGKSEQFFLELMQVPRAEAKLRVFSFKMQFHVQVSDLRKSLNIVNSVADHVRSSLKLKRIMQTVLSLGNALNQGTARGSAVGFRLDSLLKLTEIRARNNKMTLMHYLCKVISEKLPELLDFSKDLDSIEPATKIQLKFLAEEMQAINKGLEMVVQELSMSENDGPVSEKFHKNLKEFLCSAEAEGRNVDALIVYFGEDPARCQFEQVVSTLVNFTRMFNRAHEENCKQLELDKKKKEKDSENQKG